MDDIIKVFVGGSITVNLLKTDLKEIGINAIVKDGRESGSLAGFSGGTETSVELYISQSELEKAQPIINDYLSREEK